MKVEELIKELKELDQGLEVYICDEVEGNDGRLLRVEVVEVHTCYDGTDNPKDADVVMLRWS